MKKIFLFSVCFLCILFAGCTSVDLGFVSEGTYYCEELNCYLEVYSEERTSSNAGPWSVLVARGWFYDQDDVKERLNIKLDYGNNIFLSRADNPIAEETYWLHGHIQECTEEEIVVKYYKRDFNTYMSRMEQYDQDKDGKYIFVNTDLWSI